jgi:hypothetical protein
MLGSKEAHDFLLATSIVSKIPMCTSAAHVPFLLGEFQLAPWSFLLNVMGICQTLSLWGRAQDAYHSVPATPSSDLGGRIRIKTCPIRRLMWVFQVTKHITEVLTPPILFYQQIRAIVQAVRHSKKAINSRPSVRTMSNGCMPRCIIFVTPDHQNIQTSTGFDTGRLAYSLPCVR